MKKLIYVMIATALVLSIGITSAFAATETSGSETAEANKESVSDVTKAAPAVDEDGDGVCDNCRNDGTRPADGSGRQNGKGDRNQGAGFTDENGDGVCDNNPDGGPCPQDGTGQRNGRRTSGQDG